MRDAVKTWWPIKDAPLYEINDEGHIRNRESKRLLAHRHDGVRCDDPYVILRIEGKNVPRSVYILLREMQVNRRASG